MVDFIFEIEGDSMNKKQFIDEFTVRADFLDEFELESAKKYLEENLDDAAEFNDVSGFVNNVRLSFDMHGYLTQAEAVRFSESIANDVSEIMNSTAEHEMQSEGTVCEPSLDTGTEDKSTNSKSFGGICGYFKELKGAKKMLAIAAAVFICVLLAPLAVLIASISALVYVSAVTIVLSAWLIILGVVALCALTGVIAVSYGIANIVTTPPIGIMEIGLGTVLFAVMLAVWALDYQYVATVLPFVCKKINCIIKKAVHSFRILIFGKAV